MWSAKLQEKHIAMIAKSNVCFGLVILYYPFHELIEAIVHPSISSILLFVLAVLGIFWMFESSRAESSKSSFTQQYTDEYVRQVFLRSCQWALNAVIPYLAIVWFSDWWVYWLGVPETSTIGQLGFGLVLLVQGSTASWWLFRDHLSSEQE